MAIKKVAILLTIDTSKKTKGTSGTARTDDKSLISIPGADETYFVKVCDDMVPGPKGKPNKYAMLTTAAHEIGHVLSSIFKVPGGMHEDPRSTGEITKPAEEMYLDDFTPDMAKRIYSNEILAWNIAKQIRPDLHEDEALAAMETYEPLNDIAKAA